LNHEARHFRHKMGHLGVISGQVWDRIENRGKDQHEFTRILGMRIKGFGSMRGSSHTLERK